MYITLVDSLLHQIKHCMPKHQTLKPIITNISRKIQPCNVLRGSLLQLSSVLLSNDFIPVIQAMSNVSFTTIKKKFKNYTNKDVMHKDSFKIINPIVFKLFEKFKQEMNQRKSYHDKINNYIQIEKLK